MQAGPDLSVNHLCLDLTNFDNFVINGVCNVALLEHVAIRYLALCVLFIRHAIFIFTPVHRLLCLFSRSNYSHL